MVYTNFPDGVASQGVPVGGLLTNGKSFFVRPYYGSDGYDGVDPTVPFATLSKLLSKMSTGANDVGYVIASSNTAAYTTDYLSATLDWNIDLSSVIGINSDARVSQRSRVSTLSTATWATAGGATPLFKVSGNANRFDGLSFFAGAPASNPTYLKGAMTVTGSRNTFRNCHFAGAGGTGMDAAGQFSLTVTGSENYFEDCTIGLDTMARTSQTYEMYMSGGATRNIFRNCRIVTYAAAATMTFLTVPTNGLDRWNLFEGCTFINMPTGVAAGTTITQGFSITGGGSPDGAIVLKDCQFVGMGASESVASGKLFYCADSSGKMVATAF